jgi:hypothetical protein
MNKKLGGYRTGATPPRRRLPVQAPTQERADGPARRRCGLGPCADATELDYGGERSPH